MRAERKELPWSTPETETTLAIRSIPPRNGTARRTGANIAANDHIPLAIRAVDSAPVKEEITTTIVRLRDRHRPANHPCRNSVAAGPSTRDAVVDATVDMTTALRIISKIDAGAVATVTMMVASLGNHPHGKGTTMRSAGMTAAIDEARITSILTGTRTSAVIVIREIDHNATITTIVEVVVAGVIRPQWEHRDSETVVIGAPCSMSISVAAAATGEAIVNDSTADTHIIWNVDGTSGEVRSIVAVVVVDAVTITAVAMIITMPPMEWTIESPCRAGAVDRHHRHRAILSPGPGHDRDLDRANVTVEDAVTVAGGIELVHRLR